ncbi:LysR substrate-binding domain-containing protein [Consotaella aegiceratis]|uniref:LysR substrate-binding domain-containing protein n=1 Tax=Consotaella aegiceratis TaxID=3097961 RepID=UPI002F41E2B6
MLSPDDLRFFIAVANASSLAAAARALNVSAPAVTQRLHALEGRLGTHLIDRKGRRPTLTDEGELLAERGRAVLIALSELDEALAERRGQVTGHLRIIAPLGFGRRYVAPIAASFQEEHPHVKIDLTLSDRLAGVPSSSWDLAVQVDEPRNATPSLIMRTLASNARLVCAAPSYLKAFGTPVAPQDLQAHSCIALRENDEDVTLWRFGTLGGGPDVRIRIQPHLASNDGEVVRTWALAGRGIIVRSEWDVADDLRAGRLVRILRDHPLPDAPVIALLGSGHQARAARTGRFLDALANALNPVPWR